MIKESETTSGLTIHFSFRSWRAHLKKLAAPQNDGISAYRIFPINRKDLLHKYADEANEAVNGFGEPELQQYFALYFDELKVHHRSEMKAYKEFIRSSYLKLFGTHLAWPLGAEKIENLKASHGEISKWEMADHNKFNLLVLVWEKYLCDVDHRGRIPAIALLALRRSNVRTCLHTQPTDVIKIIAKICMRSGWSFAWRVNYPPQTSK
jgi:hypothetical protein